MDCGSPRIIGPKAKEAYEYIMNESEKAKADKESIIEKRKKKLSSLLE